MSLLVAFTACVGFLASYALLRLGLHAMWLRYLVAFAAAYTAFLGLLWLWLRSTRLDLAPTDVPDMFQFDPHDGSVTWEGGGGSFGGAGASGSYEAPQPAGLAKPVGAASSKGRLADAASLDDTVVPILLALCVVATLGLLAVWVIYWAPSLFAELLLDGVFAASLYRRVRHIERAHWLRTALGRTWWPCLIAAVLVSSAGWAMARIVPGAATIGEVIHAKTSRGD